MVLLVLGVGACVCVGVAGCVWWRWSDARARRQLRRVRHRGIGAVREGDRVRVVGVVRADTPLRAPLSRRPCAAWRVVVEEGSDKHAWEVVRDVAEASDFALADDTGDIWVDTAQVRLLLDYDATFVPGTFGEAGERAEAFVAARRLSSAGRSFRCREGVVAIGETVGAVGVASLPWRPDASALVGYRSPDGARLVLRAPRHDQPLLLSDEPGALEAAS